MDWITSMVDPPPMMPNLTVTTTPYPMDITTTTTISTTTPILLTTMAALLSNLTADEFQTVKVTENPLVFDEKDLAFTEFPDFTDYDWEPAYNAPLVSTRTTEEAPKLNNVVCKFPKDLLFDMPAVSHNYIMERMKLIGKWDEFKDQVCEGYKEPLMPVLSFITTPHIVATTFFALSATIIILIAVLIALIVLVVSFKLVRKGSKKSPKLVTPPRVKVMEPTPIILTQPKQSEMPTTSVQSEVTFRPRGAYWNKRPTTLSLHIPPPLPPRPLLRPDPASLSRPLSVIGRVRTVGKDNRALMDAGIEPMGENAGPKGGSDIYSEVYDQARRQLKPIPPRQEPGVKNDE